MGIGAVMAWIGAGLPIMLLCGFVSGLMGMLLGLYLVFSSDLPSFPDLRAYRPKTVSTFYADDGTVIGLFYREKRFPVPIGSLPPHVINAFVAAEDARFFSHTGLDWGGVARALVINIKAGNFAQGGSTITQQVTRNFILSKEKKISRKVREAILAFRLEKTLTKNEILELYLNEIYLGRGAYGVEAAAGTYFGKTAQNLGIAETALIAGLASNPSKLSQQKNLDACLRKRGVVLERMLKNGFISKEQYDAAMQDTPQFREDLPTPFQKVPYFTEAVRQYIVARYGENKLYNDGIKVWTTCDLDLQKVASDSLLAGAKAWEKRQGRPPGLVKRLDSAELNYFLKTAPAPQLNPGDIVQAVVIANNVPKKRKGKNPENDLQDCALSLQGNIQFTMKLSGERQFRQNDLLQFRVLEHQGDNFKLEHHDVPPIQGAVVCIENNTGYVRSLVGGLDFDQSNFNRATQGLRQPGSAFKPFVYATALERFAYSPRTMIVDEPIAVVLDPRDPPWIPVNSDGGFLGPITLSQALSRSRNIAVIKLLMDVGTDATVQMARNMGLRSPLRKHLSLSLGASEVTLLELASAYTVFPNVGVRIQPVFVKKVVDRFGNVLEDNVSKPLNTATAAIQEARIGEKFHGPANSSRPGSYFPTTPNAGLIEEMRSLAHVDPKKSLEIESLLDSSFPSRPIARPPMQRVLSPQTAYLMVSMLRETCVTGTASAASRLRRSDIAGKTGTTDDCTDAWFIGFNPKLTVGVWMGYDTKIPLGKREHGNVAALPVWMDFMKKALYREPVRDFAFPPEIVFRNEASPSATGAVVNPLEAEPDLPSNAQAKLVSPIDADYFPVYSYGYPEMGQIANRAFGFFNYFGNMRYASGPEQGIRLLSPSGESLGQGILTRDEKGRLTLVPQSQSLDDRLQAQHQMFGLPWGFWGSGTVPYPPETDWHMRQLPRGGSIE